MSDKIKAGLAGYEPTTFIMDELPLDPQTREVMKRFAHAAEERMKDDLEKNLFGDYKPDPTPGWYEEQRRAYARAHAEQVAGHINEANEGMKALEGGLAELAKEGMIPVGRHNWDALREIMNRGAATVKENLMREQLMRVEVGIEVNEAGDVIVESDDAAILMQQPVTT